MFFGNTRHQQQPVSSTASNEEVSTDDNNDDWQHIPIDDDDDDDDEDLVDAPVPLLLDPSFEMVEDENGILIAEEQDTSPSHQEQQILMTMEALVQNGRAPNDKWTTYLCVLSIAALLFGVGGSSNTTNHATTFQVPAAVVVEDLKPFPIYDAYIAMPPRMGEPVVSPDVKFDGMKSHEKPQVAASLTAMAPVGVQQRISQPDYAAFVAAQKANPPPKHALRTKMGAEESKNPRPTKPSAVPISKTHGGSLKRRPHWIGGVHNETASIPSVDDPRPPEKFPEHDDDDNDDKQRLSALEKRIAELEEHNEDLLERFVRTAGDAADWKKKAATLNKALGELKEDRDALLETVHANKPLKDHHLSNPYDALPRSKKPMATVGSPSSDQEINATAAVSRRRDLRDTSALPSEKAVVPASPTALIPSPA